MITQEHAIQILREARAQAFNKRTRCYDLSVAWAQGNYRAFSWKDLSGDLQRIRNQFGGSWLARVSLKKGGEQ